jgi:NTP pyrophosphatase (non-canonical NTP hydrolase)
MNKEIEFTLNEYSLRIRKTDKLKDINLLLFGLYGEVGSILTTAKKHKRDGMAFHYQRAITEELGDAFWYLARISDELGYKLEELTPVSLNASKISNLFPTDHPCGPIAHLTKFPNPKLKTALRKLGESSANVLGCKIKTKKNKQILKDFFVAYLKTVRASKIGFAEILRYNLKKTEGRFLEPKKSALKIFDEKFSRDEQIPNKFKIEISERSNGKSYLKWHGVFIGDPLTDNIKDPDGYRFHDVFHMANAAILNWSPTFRSLIKHKRKSDPKADEIQDGGRAIVIEEGLTAWIFSIAKESNFFKNQDRLSFDLLKNIQQFVSGYEVQKCPLKLWERSILDGYKVFRKMKKNKGGIIIGNRKKRTIRYKPLRKSA